MYDKMSCYIFLFFQYVFTFIQVRSSVHVVGECRDFYTDQRIKKVETRRKMKKEVMHVNTINEICQIMSDCKNERNVNLAENTIFVFLKNVIFSFFFKNVNSYMQNHNSTYVYIISLKYFPYAREQLSPTYYSNLKDLDSRAEFCVTLVSLYTSTQKI